jgi:hypothetical protein
MIRLSNISEIMPVRRLLGALFIAFAFWGTDNKPERVLFSKLYLCGDCVQRDSIQCRSLQPPFESWANVCSDQRQRHDKFKRDKRCRFLF